MGIAWILFGALIGVSAAQRKGFGVAGGVIGGLLLGPLAFLMYAVDGGKARCPACAEWANRQASVCPHCRNPIEWPPKPETPGWQKVVYTVLIGALLLLLAFVIIVPLIASVAGMFFGH